MTNKDTLKERGEWTEWRKKLSESWWNYWNYQGDVPDRDFIEKFWTEKIEEIIEQTRKERDEEIVEVIKSCGHQQDDDTIWCDMDEIINLLTKENE